MNPAIEAIALSIGLFIGMIACLEIGYHLGHRHSKNIDGAHEGVGAIEAAVFALLGLLLGFSFAGAASRLDTRRDLIVQEANAIGTAYLRLDLLPAANQPEEHRLFREYINSRLSFYDKVTDTQAAAQQLARSQQVQQSIWSAAIAASRTDPTQNVSRLLLPALNDMIDITTSRTVALGTRLPTLILILLLSVALLSGLLAGYAMAKRTSRSWFHMIVYALAVTVTTYAVIDLDQPRSGLIRLDAADKALTDLRETIR